MIKRLGGDLRYIKLRVVLGDYLSASRAGPFLEVEDHRDQHALVISFLPSILVGVCWVIILLLLDELF